MRYTKSHMMRRYLSLLALPFSLDLVLLLAACGNVPTATSSTGVASQASPTATQTKASPTPTLTIAQSQAYGCPGNQVVTTTPAPATVTLSTATKKTSATVAKGNTVEINLPFGQTWSGPLFFSQNIVAMQSPAGYALPAAKACVWRFVALSSGTTTLSFSAHPSCTGKRVCPMYIVSVHFTITIQ